jgi:hypothetical protein
MCKQCRKCDNIKDISLFKKINNRILDWCDDCCNEYEMRLSNKRLIKNNIPVVDPGYKFCHSCHTIKKQNEFIKNNQTSDGLTCYCKSCLYKTNKKYKNKNYKKNTKTDLDRKFCTECSKSYTLDDFRKKSKICKHCSGIIRNLRLERISNKNKTMSVKIIHKECKECNETKLISYFKRSNNYLDGFENICKTCKEKKRTKKRDRTKETEKSKNRMLEDPIYCAKMIIHRNVRGAFNSQDATKNKICKEYGIDIQHIINNIGTRPYKHYQLDHIIPVAVFDLRNEEHVRLCYCVENLRWISQKQNGEKNDRIVWSLIEKNDKLLQICEQFNITKEFDTLRISDLRREGKYAQLF